MKAFFARNEGITDATSENYFHVNNCGYYEDIGFEMKVNRKSGRKDYQMIYVHRGLMKFIFDNKSFEAKEGTLVIYRPHQPQIYSAIPECQTSYFWIHFTGTSVLKIMSELCLDKFMYYTGVFPEFAEGCKKMVYEYMNKSEYADVMASGITITLLSLILKKCCRNSPCIFDNIKKTISNDLFNERTIAEYAKMHKMSEYHFIRSFKAACGETPHSYKIRITVEKAKLLLEETDLCVSEISSTLGFSDPLYFSRIFKRKTGLSPLSYRKKIVDLLH